MLLSIQFPLADSRSFLESSGRLDKPGWPIPSHDEEFVRSYGAVRIRPHGGLEGWVGENEVCEAKRAVRIDNPPRVVSSNLKKNFPLRVAYRRFYFDGFASGKFELGMVTSNRRILSLGKQDLKNLIEKFLEMRIRVSLPNRKFHNSALVDAGKYLAASYLEATTANKLQQIESSWFVRSGTPLLFFQCSVTERIELPYDLRTVDIPSELDFNLYSCLVPFDGRQVKMWILEYEAFHHLDLNAAASRRLRIYLLRLHAEHECLRLVLRNLMDKTLKVMAKSVESDSLQDYLNEATKRIGILESRASSQYNDEVSRIARESMNTLNPGQTGSLKRVLDSMDIRKNISRKVKSYAEQWENTNLTIIGKIEENYVMGDVFNDVNKSIIATRGSIARGVIDIENSGNGNIASAISELDGLIANSSDEYLNLEKKKECTDLLSTIADEAKKQEPSKSVLKALGTSLLSILTSVEPLAKAAKKSFDILKPLWT